MTDLATTPSSSAGRLRLHVAELLRLALPVIVSRAGTMTLLLVDTVVVGHFSAQHLAYLGIGLAPFGVLVIGALGLLLGTLVMVAQAFGAGEYAECGRVWRRSLPYALGLGVVAAGLCGLGEPFLRLTGQAPDVAEGGGLVLLILGLGAPAHLLGITTTFFLEGVKRPVPGMIGMIGANLLNLGLNLVLVFGAFGLPELGAAGSAAATTAVRWVYGLGLVAYVWWMPGHARFAVREKPAEPWRAGRAQRRLGYAAGASLGLETSAFAMMPFFAGWLGPLSLAGYSIALNLMALVFMAAIGLGSATAVLVGHAHGRGDTPGMALAGWTGLGVNTVVMAAAAAGVLAFAEPLARLYAADPELIVLTASLFTVVAATLIPDGGQGVLANALRGRGDAWVPAASHFVSYYAVMVPLAWVLALEMGRGVRGLLEAIFVASVVSVALLAARFAQLTRRDARAGRAAAEGRD